MNKPTALIIEDSILVLMGLELLLDDLGIEIIGVASTLETALELAASSQPDLVMLDINLHGKMSFPVADILYARGVPIIFTSGYASQEILPPRYAGTPSIQKPYDSAALMSMIDKILA